MNICYVLYELDALQSLNATSSLLKREGALLKVTFDSGVIGYGDCHAWPELGDLPVKQQLTHLAHGKFTPLTRCALEFARLDAASRAHGKSLFEHKQIPKSHFLVNDILNWNQSDVQRVIQQGYTHVKLKVGRAIDREVEILQTLFQDTSLKLRLDFNETLAEASFHCFLQCAQKMQAQIDFIEDPFPFHAQKWADIQKEGWVLACDRQAHQACHQPHSAAILIVKPALQSLEEWQRWTDQTRIVTSYLGHPIGQVAAAYTASHVDPTSLHVHGLLSHHAYQVNSFSKHLNWEGSSFTLPPGYGCGFDQELEQLKWMQL